MVAQAGEHPTPPPPPARRARVVAVGLSGLMVAGLAIVYGARPDACAAITVFPAWAWLAPGLILTIPGWRRPGRRGAAIVAAAWLAFLLAFAEEPWSLLRLATAADPTWPEKRGRGEAFRVVTLNCDIGNPKAAAEVGEFDPDIVLLQESPGREAVERLAGELFGPGGGFVSGVDASLIARGRVVPAELPATLRATFVQARVRLNSGAEVEVISTRLIPAVFRLDLWTPDCWREQTANRQKRRDQLRAIADRIDAVPDDVPVLLGGDFNAPQGDAIFRLLRPRLHDTFAEGGRGWGNTILNAVPCLRIDQVWASPTLRATRVVARRTRHSDHRLVACDLVILSPAKPFAPAFIK